VLAIDTTTGEPFLTGYINRLLGDYQGWSWRIGPDLPEDKDKAA
jgi:hypothetical protein